MEMIATFLIFDGKIQIVDFLDDTCVAERADTLHRPRAKEGKRVGSCGICDGKCRNVQRNRSNQHTCFLKHHLRMI